MAVRTTPANSLMKSLGQGSIDLLADTIRVTLVTSLFQTDVEWPAWAAVTAYAVGNIIRPTTPDGHAFEATTAGDSAATEPTFNESAGGGSTTADGTVIWTDLGILPPLLEFADRGMVTPAPTTWAASTGYTAGDFVIPTSANGHVYEATTTGTSDTMEPTFPIDRSTVADNTVIWQDIGMNPAGAEAVGTGYTAGGNEITTKTLINPLTSPRRTFFDGDDVTYSTATVTARTGCIYRVGTVDSIINPFLGFVIFNDAPADVGSVAADFIIKWNTTEGILRLRNLLV